MSLILVLLLEGCGPTPLARVPEASRLAEMANGELLVGTRSGRLFLVSTFGDVRLAATLPSALVELVGDPRGGYAARTADGHIWEGGLFESPRDVGNGARLLLRDCESTHWYSDDDPAFPVEVTALALADCEHVARGTRDGGVNGAPLASSAILRLQRVDTGYLWVAANGSAGCARCVTPVPDAGVVDAIPLHVPPLLHGEFAWIGAGDQLWIGAD